MQQVDHHVLCVFAAAGMRVIGVALSDDDVAKVAAGHGCVAVVSSAADVSLDVLLALLPMSSGGDPRAPEAAAAAAAAPDADAGPVPDQVCQHQAASSHL